MPRLPRRLSPELLCDERAEHDDREEGGLQTKKNDGAATDFFHLDEGRLEADGANRDHQAGTRDLV